MKPYVNFIELESPEFKEVKQALQHLGRVLFPGDNKTIRNANLQWHEWESVVILMFELKGKKKALFLGHSRRWAGTPLV